MTLALSPTAVRRLDLLRVVFLTAIAAAIGHQVIYTIRFGDGADLIRALTADGHDVSLPILSLLALAAVGLFAGLSIWRSLKLEQAVRLPARRNTRPDSSAEFMPLWASTTSRVAPLVVVVFVLQENVEHFFSHGHIEGLAVLGGSGALLTLASLFVTAAVVSLVGLFVRWREVVLEHRLVAQRGDRPPRVAVSAPAQPWNADAAVALSRWIIARRTSGRAPPRVASI